MSTDVTRKQTFWISEPQPMREDRFARIRAAIEDRKPMSPPPYFDLNIGKGIRQAFLGRKIESLKDDVEFWRQAGLCLYPANFGFVQRPGELTVPDGTVAHAHYSLYDNEDVDMNWAQTGKGAVTSEEDFENYPWPDANETDLSFLDKVQPLLPEGMRAAANIGKIFTGTWQLMGFTFFCEALRDNPKLVERVFERVAAIQTRLTERVIAHPVIGAVLHADDLAYFSGPMVNPAIYRRYVFPAYKQMGEMCRRRGILYLYHSDGQMKDLIGDIVDCGFSGLHPIEPKPMDGVAIKAKWGRKICLLGHIDVDLLARGTPQQVREQTQRNLDQLARDGGYCPGSGNSVPDYVPVANFVAMIEAIQRWN